MNPIPDTLVRIGGGDEAALELVPSARPAFIQIAVALLLTAAMATVSMWFTLHDAVDVHWFYASVLAPFWGVVIFGMDRTLMVLGMGGSRIGTFASVGGRLLAAALIGVVVSTPLTLRVFASDIDAGLAEMRAAQSATNKEWIAGSQEAERANGLQQQVSDWENIAAGVLPATFADPSSSALADQLTKLKKQLAQDQHAADQAAILYTCDTYGGGRDQLDDPAKCAAKPGLNGNSALYKRQADAAAQTVIDDRAEIESLEARLQDANREKLALLRSQAPDQLATLRSRLDEAEAALRGFGSDLEDANNGNTGLLVQLTALREAGEENKDLMAAHLLIALLFLLIEVLPVTAKLAWLFSPGGKAYDDVVRSIDDCGTATAQTRRADAQIRAETAYEAALIGKDAELDLEQLAAEHHQWLMRIQQEAEVRIERARADDLVALTLAVDAEFNARREAELRRRAEAGFNSWADRPSGPFGRAFGLGALVPATGAAGEHGAQSSGRRWWGVGRTSR